MQHYYNLICKQVNNHELIEYSIRLTHSPRITVKYLKEGKYSDFFQMLSVHISSDEPRQLLWHVVNQKSEVQLCACGKPLKWVRSLQRYRTTCSPACAGKNKSDQFSKKEKIKKVPYYKDPVRLAAGQSKWVLTIK